MKSDVKLWRSAITAKLSIRMNISVYLAYVTVLSELMSVVQSILSLTGLPLNYVSLFIFSLFVLPALAQVSLAKFIIVLCVLALQILKSALVGVGPEFSKALMLVLLAAIFILVGQRMFVEDFIKVLRRLRWYTLCLGSIYVLIWIMLGQYRNASTFSLAVMAFLGFQGSMRLSSLAFAVSAKTLFQLLSFTVIISWFTRSLMARTIFVAACVAFGALAPILLVVFITPEMIIFTASHTASLFERLLESHTLIENIKDSWSVIIWGDRLGWVLESSLIGERGYVHANHLWLVRTFGLPIWLIGVIFMIKNARYGSWQIIGIRTLVFASQAFLMTLFTSPFLTMILLCRAKNQR